MLTCPTATPFVPLAGYVDAFLRDAPWVRRRVETVAFLDVDTVTRQTTLDIGVAEVRDATVGCPLYPDRPLVPLAMLQKGLLVDFDLRDRTGAALEVTPRDIDSFFAWSALCFEAGRVIGVRAARRRCIRRRLRAIASNFPDHRDGAFSEYLHSWELPDADWTRADELVWGTLLQDESFSRLLREFTFNFILMTQLEVTESAIQLVKFSYQQHLPYSKLYALERLGLTATELDIQTPAVGAVRSYHLQIQAPQDLVLTDVLLFREEEGESLPRSAESYQARVNAESAQVYTTSPPIDPADHVVTVSMRVPVAGYLRAVWLTTVAATAVLTAGRIFVGRVEAAIDSRADAAVALLLVAPSLLAAYLVRPGEHAIASRLLRPIRYALSLTGALSYSAASFLVLDVKGLALSRAWTALAVGAGLIAAAMTVVVALTRHDLKAAANLAALGTDQRTILVVPPEP